MNKKKSLLFVCYGLGIGGIERCLVNLLNVLPEERYDVDLLILNPEYAMLDKIRRKVRCLDAFTYTLNTEFTMKQMKAHGGIWKNKKKLLKYIDHRVRIKLGLPLWKTFESLEAHYDVAVAYSQNGLGPYYVIDKVSAGRKVLWYHNGAYAHTGRQYALDRQYYPQFDQVVTVSRDCQKMLLDKFPILKDKLLVLRNICDAEDILKKSRAFRPDSFRTEGTHIVTVGRMSAEKGADLALEACRQLLASGWNVIWHWVGDGPDAEAVAKKIDQYGLNHYFLLEGNQDNPYPYIASAGIYVQPSFYEAYSTTVTEAKVLRRPILVTDVGGMRDQLTDGVNGKIVPIAPDAIAQGVAWLLEHEAEAGNMAKELKKECYQQEAVLREYEATVFH